MPNYSQYLTATEQEIKWGFYITTVGYSKTYPNQPYPQISEHPTSHSFNWNNGRILKAFYLVFISKGNGLFESAVTAQEKILEGTCFFLFPGIWHRYKPDLSSGWQEYWVGFEGTYPDHLFKNGFFKPETPFIHGVLNELLLTLFQQLIETVKNSTFNYQQIISGITLQIMGVVKATIANQQLDYNSELTMVEKVKYLMQENIEIPLDILDIIEEFSRGYSSFRKAFKLHTGYSPNQYYLDVRLKKATELMLVTNLNFKEIAYKTGFSSQYYFSKFFKKKYKINPKQYRTQKKLLAIIRNNNI